MIQREPPRWHHGFLLVTFAAFVVAGCGPISPPVTPVEMSDFAAAVRGDMEASAVPFEGVLSPDEAVERAVLYNHEVRAAMLEAAVSAAAVRVERGELLPDAIEDSSYFRRNRLPLSRSSRSDLYSTSSDLATITHNLELSLNILDFGLTLIRMRQAGDVANQKVEAARRVAADIAELTRATYWQAVAQQTLQPKYERLAPKIDDAMRLARLAAKDAALDPMESIDLQRELLSQRRELDEIALQLSGTDQRLMSLVNIPPRADLKLDVYRINQSIALPSTSAEDDIATALMHRPEIRERFYQLRIGENDIRAAVLNVLPGAALTQTFARDSTSYLLSHDWMSWSVRATANLVNLARLPEKLDGLKQQQDLNRQQAIVTATAIATEIYVARARLSMQSRIYRDANDYHENQIQILRQVRNSARAGQIPEQMIVREELATLLAEVRAIIAFGDLQAAHAAYRKAIGPDVDSPARG